MSLDIIPRVGSGLHRIIVGVDYGTTFRYVRKYAPLLRLVLISKPHLMVDALSKLSDAILNAHTLNSRVFCSLHYDLRFNQPESEVSLLIVPVDLRGTYKQDFSG